MMNKPHNEKSLKRIINAMKFSYQGIQETFKSEVSFRQDLLIFIINCIALFFVSDLYFITWLFFCGLFLLFAELTNTAIECVVDYISRDIHPLAKKAKDIGSALVFLALTNLIVSWTFYLYSYLK